MLKIGHVISCNEIWLPYIYKICKYKISKEIKHYLIVDRHYGYVSYLRQANITCLILKDKILFKNALKKMNIINFHWDGYDNQLHDFAIEMKTPFLVTLYASKKLPPSIPVAVCTFNHIRAIQSHPDRFAVIHEGLDLERLARISKYKKNLKKKKWTLIAPDSSTQCNDKFWVAMGEILLKYPHIELKIIAPGWKSLERTKAINDNRTIYRNIAQADVAICTTAASDPKSFYFVMIAMAMGIPCVVSINKITSALMKHKKNAIFISTDRPTYFAKDVINLLQNNKLRNRCILNAKQIVRDNFDIMANVKKYESILDAVVHNKLAGFGR